MILGGVSSPLEEAHAHVVRGELVAALEATLEAWRATRDAETAGLVTTISDRLLASRGKDGKGIRDPARWLAAAEDAGADVVGRLASTLFAVKQVDARARFGGARAFPADPRMSRALERGLLEPPWVGRASKDDFAIAFELCVQHADPGLVATLERLATESYRRGTSAEMNVWMTAQCGVAARAGREVLATTARPDDAGREALARELAATERGHGRGERSEQELLDAIWADPESDELRLVYGDFLLERSDPRGEIFALQWKALRGEATEEDRAREATLVEKRLRPLLGPLHGGIATGTAVIERGFVTRGTIEVRLEKDTARLRQHPAWATLRSVRISRRGQTLEPSFFGGGVFRDLREIWDLDAASAGELLAVPPPRLEVVGAEIGAVTPELLAPLTHLRHLHLSDNRARRGDGVAVFRRVLASARARTLERLELGVHGGLETWLPFLLAHDPGCPRIVCAPSGPPRPEKQGVWHVLRLDASGRRSILDMELRGESTHAVSRQRVVDDYYRVMAMRLADLEPGLLTEIRFVSSPPSAERRAAFEAAARRQPLTRLELPDPR